MRIFFIFVILTMQSAVLVAQDVTILGPLKQKVPSAKQTVNTSQQTEDEVTLLRVQLSDRAKQSLKNRLDEVLDGKNNESFASSLPCTKQLGMNDVPVFKQGGHGTCATFAATAAIDAALGKGDYASQLCLLQLGKYLARRSFAHNGWQGEPHLEVFYKLSLYGLITTEQQVLFGCGGETNYPTYDPEPEGFMRFEEYRLHSLSLDSLGIAWSSMFDKYQIFESGASATEELRSIKSVLNQGNRIVFSVLLAGLNSGTVGATAKFHEKNDTWVLTKEIIDDVRRGDADKFGAHAMVITGYDDFALAVDENGTFHRGLITLRNSWGPDKGDQGDFYMSYEYFKLFRHGAVQIRKVKPE